MPAYQLPRNYGGFHGSENLPVGLKRAPRPGSVEQHDGDSLYQSPRQSQVTPPLQDGSVPPILGTEQTPLVRAVHVPGGLNLGADMLSRGNVAPWGTWTLHPQMVQEIWSVFGKAEVDLFTSEDNSEDNSRPAYFSMQRDALVHDWPSAHLYAYVAPSESEKHHFGG